MKMLMIINWSRKEVKLNSLLSSVGVSKSTKATKSTKSSEISKNRFERIIKELVVIVVVLLLVLLMEVILLLLSWL
jgi:hypothetical protein